MRLGSCSLLALVAGCVGGFGGEPAGTAPPAQGKADDPPAPGVIAQPPAACPTAHDPGPAPLRRLTNAEYRSSVRDLLGVDVSAVVATFPSDFKAGGFDNAAAAQSLSALHADGFARAAEEVAAKVVSTPALRASAVGCDPAAAGCLRTFVERFARRAFRRPLQATEIDRLLALAATETDPLQAVAVTIEGVLQSPKFLFRAEVGAPARPGLLALTGHELATRLSYFLIGTTPDDPLLDAAARGQLDDPAGVEAAARGLLKDPRARSALAGFTGQWFQLGLLGEAMRDRQQHPAFSPELLAAMHGEATRLLDDALWSVGSFLDVYTARHAYVDDSLAKLYGVARPPGAGLARVELGDSADRGGLMTTAALHTLTTRGNTTSPILRGKYVREAVLCDRLPPPLPGVAMLEIKPGETAVDAEERHTADPTCAGCHLLIDPIGHGLERYDALGAVRTAYSGGQPVKQTGHIEGLAGSTFSGGVELGKLVRNSDAGRTCVLKKTFRFALGREEDPEVDGCTLARIDRALAGRSFAELVVALVTSDAFRFRRAHLTK